MCCEWQKIETAPKDGTSILGYWMGGKHDCAIHAVKWFRDNWWESNEDYRTSKPSHWMPLPAPPLLATNPNAGGSDELSC